MLRVMLDSNIFDEIIKTPGLAGQPTAVFVLDVSRLGQARLGEGHEGGLEYDTLHGENPKRVRDAVIALTAAAAAEAEDVEAFVTVDDRLARRVSAKAKTLKVWNFTEFRLRVTSDELSSARPED